MQNELNARRYFSQEEVTLKFMMGGFGFGKIDIAILQYGR